MTTNVRSFLSHGFLAHTYPLLYTGFLHAVAPVTLSSVIYKDLRKGCNALKTRL